MSHNQKWRKYHDQGLFVTLYLNDVMYVALLWALPGRKINLACWLDLELSHPVSSSDSRVMKIVFSSFRIGVEMQKSREVKVKILLDSLSLGDHIGPLKCVHHQTGSSVCIWSAHTHTLEWEHYDCYVVFLRITTFHSMLLWFLKEWFFAHEFWTDMQKKRGSAHYGKWAEI